MNNRETMELARFEAAWTAATEMADMIIRLNRPDLIISLADHMENGGFNEAEAPELTEWYGEIAKVLRNKVNAASPALQRQQPKGAQRGAVLDFPLFRQRSAKQGGDADEE